VVGKAGLKAGLIGIVIMVIVTVINQFLLLPAFPGSQVFTLISCGVNVVLYIGIGVLAGLFVAPPRTPGQGAKAGVIAGAIAAVVSVVIGVAIMTIRMASGAGIPGLDPEQMKQLTESGANMTLIVIASGALGAVCGAGLGAGGAAGGGALVAAIKPD
jgi:hypothetical protein